MVWFSNCVISALFLTVPPQSATIRGGGTPVKAGQQVTLTCESSLSNPKAVITWYSRGKIITANSDTVYTPGSNGGFTSRSSVTVTMSEQENNAMYICNAVSDNRAPVATANVTLSVLCKYQCLSVSVFLSVFASLSSVYLSVITGHL